MNIGHRLFVRESDEPHPFPTSEASFHIQINYWRFHQSLHPVFRRTLVDSHAVNFSFPGERILSPETGAAAVREIFRHCDLSRTVLDAVVSHVLSFARDRAAHGRNASHFPISLQVSLLGIFFDSNISRHSQEVVDQAVRGILEGEEDQEVHSDLVPPSRASVEALEKVSYDALSPSEKEWICAVCLDEFAKGGEKGFRRMPCLHVFHEDCIFEWLKTAHSCPLCRHAL